MCKNTALKMLRAKYDLTQDEIAKRLGVVRSTYHNVENGKSKGSMLFWLRVKTEFPEINIEDVAQARKGGRNEKGKKDCS